MIVKMGPKGSVLVTKSSVSVAPAFKVPAYKTSDLSYSHQVYMYHSHRVSLCNVLNLSTII